jgi:putative salt-induced outer membrane protein YdiY
MKYAIIFLILLTELQASTVRDSLIFKNGNNMQGEIKSMDRGVLIIETDYSDKDFKVEWDKIRWISTESSFMVTFKSGIKEFGQIQSVSDSEIVVISENGKGLEHGIENIVNLIPIKDNFFERLYASIDLGWSMTKAHNLRQLSSRSNLGYREKIWSADISYNSLFSQQDSIDETNRSEGALNYRYNLPKRWYAIATLSMLSNTEQKLELRMNSQIGLGKFIIRSNNMYWGAKLGVNRNMEKYYEESSSKLSWEGYIGTELNLYDIGDLNLQADLIAYPGITENNRLRSDISIDLKYDLPYDLYIKIGATVNYDNQPTENASKSDYVLQTGFGWEWN